VDGEEEYEIEKILDFGAPAKDVNSNTCEMEGVPDSENQWVDKDESLLTKL